MSRGPSTPRTASLRARRVAGGLCPTCDGPNDRAPFQCSECLEAARVKRAEDVAHCRATLMCVHCRKRTHIGPGRCKVCQSARRGKRAMAREKARRLAA